MRNRKLYHLLALLGEEDRQRFTLFIQSPYFNTNKPLILFWERWQEVSSEPGFSKESFLQGTPLKASRFDNYCSLLYQKVQEFLTHETLGDNTPIGRQLLSQGILKRDSTLQSFTRFIPQIHDELEQTPHSAERYLGLFYQREEAWMAKVNARKIDATWAEDFREMQDLLKQFFLTKGLQMSCGAANLNHIFAQDLSHSAIIDAEIIREQGFKNSDPLPKLYSYTQQLQLESEDSGTFQPLLEMLKEHRHLLSDTVSHEICQYILNHCVRQLNAGNNTFLEHTHDLYTLLLENGDLLDDGLLSPQQFKNAVSLGCRLGRHQWVETFIRSYLPRLSDGHGGTAEKYNQAVLAFHQERFSVAIPSFRQVISEPTHDVFYGLDARIYLWKSYFEYRMSLKAEEVDDMYRLYDSFRLYVDRNPRISDTHRLQYRNFIRLFKRFTELIQFPADEKRQRSLLAFAKVLQAEPDVANKTWFSSKVNQVLQP